MIRISYNGDVYEYLNTFIFNGIRYYSMINGEGKVIYLRIVEDNEIRLEHISVEETNEINKRLIKRRDSVHILELNDINAINTNLEIQHDYKESIIKAVDMIANKYPELRNELIKKLKDITIREPNEEEKEDLKRYDYKAAFYPNSNTIVLPDMSINVDELIYLIVHELFHLISYDKENDRVGFLDISTSHGVSINEGVTEYLTRTVCCNNTYITGYEDDLNYTNLISTVIDTKDIVDAYVNGGLSKLHQLYTEKSGNTITFWKMILNMDMDYSVRIEKEDIVGNFKEQYLLTFLEDYKNIGWYNIWYNETIESTEDIDYLIKYIKGVLEELTSNEEYKDTISERINSVESHLKNNLIKFNETRNENKEKFDDTIINI